MKHWPSRYEVRPIGRVHSALKRAAEAPKQGYEGAPNRARSGWRMVTLAPCASVRRPRISPVPPIWNPHMPSAPADPAARINQLERELQQVRAFAVAAALLPLALILTGFTPKAAPVVRAERLELVSTTGVRQAILSADTSGFDLMLLDQHGRPSGRLRLTDEPWLSVLTGRGDEAAGLGAPKPHHLTD